MDKQIKQYLSKIGQKGGRVSRRKLSTSDAKIMVKLREAKKAYTKYHSLCFWSYDPNLKITKQDIKWVGKQLLINGNMQIWRKGKYLCQ